MRVDQPIIAFMNESIVNPYHLFHKKLDELISMIQKN